MKRFVRKCLCEKNGMEFQAQDNFDANAVDEFYCPRCLDRAMPGTLMINLQKVFDIETGIWGVKFNEAVLSEQDKDFKKGRDYLINLFKSGRIIFGFLAKPGHVLSYEVLGLMGETMDEEFVEEVKKDMEKDQRKKHKPRLMRRPR